jgi:hypothetical protein
MSVKCDAPYRSKVAFSAPQHCPGLGGGSWNFGRRFQRLFRAALLLNSLKPLLRSRGQEIGWLDSLHTHLNRKLVGALTCQQNVSCPLHHQSCQRNRVFDPRDSSHGTDSYRDYLTPPPCQR